MHKLAIRSVLASGAGFAAVVAATLVGLPAPGVAQQGADLSGTWSGGGRVQFSSGAVESARCRASFRRQGGSSFAMSASCATPSARVDQTAVLSRTGGNRFAGEFYNSQYGITGSINISVNGNRLSASLSGGGASAHLSLSR